VSSRRLLALLCTAVVGVLLAVGLVVTSLVGAVAGALYGLVALALLGVGAVRGRRLLAPEPLPAGRTCSCCTTTHFDPAVVIE